MPDDGQADRAGDELESGGQGGSAGSSPGAAGSGSAGSDFGDADVGGPDSDLPDPGGSDAGGPESDGSSPEPPDGPGDGGDSGASGSEGCVNRPVVNGCDPTVADACTAGMQCVIDLLAPTPTGYCVFSTPFPDSGICYGSGVTESCPPTFTCFFNVCREICLCDDDCSTGRCCGEPVGTQGFKLCADC